MMRQNALEEKRFNKAYRKKILFHTSLVSVLFISAMAAGELLRGSLLADFVRLEQLAAMVRNGEPLVRAVYAICQGLGENVPV